MPDVGQEASSAEGAGPRERIFQAAIFVALRDGFGKVTLSLVAGAAGFSKGGLLYHFPTKNGLIRAMLDHYADPAARHALPLQVGEESFLSDLDPFVVAVLIAAADNPVLLEPFQAQLRSDEPDLTGAPGSTSGHLGLVANLVAKFSFATLADERRRKSEAFVVRHRTDETLLGLFVAQDIDALWDMVDEFSDPAQYEYRPITNGALILSKHETDVDASSAACRRGKCGHGGELSGGLVDAMIAKGGWAPFHAADEGSGVVARILEQRAKPG